MKTLEDIMNEVDSVETLIRKTLVYVSPVTQDLEYRVAYFHENFEANIWESDMEERYEKLNITHTIYTDLVRR